MLQDILAGINGRSKEKIQTDANGRHSPLRDPAPEADDRLDALKRVLESEHFRTSDRNKRFLRFVVEETVAGRADRIKAFTVAVDVFGRDSTFDASVDPIVRIAAGHLRRALRDYYAGHGASDPVHICLPLGTYVPTFLRRESMPRRAMGHMRRLVAHRRNRLQSGAVGVAMALAAGGAAFIYLSLGAPGPSAPQKPVVVVASVRAQAQDEAAAALAQSFTQALWIALNSQDTVRMVGVRPEEKFSEALAQAQLNFGGGVPLYQLLSALRLEGDELHLYWHVLDGRSNETYLSASSVEMLAPESRANLPDAMAREVAASLNRLAAGAGETADGSGAARAGRLPWALVGWE